MKRLLVILVILISTNLCFGQDWNKIANYEFKSAESYVEAEADVLKAANYLFNNPTSKENEYQRLLSAQFIILWMEGTEHTFELGDESMELTKGSNDLFSLLLAGMAKVVLENKDANLSTDDVYTKTEALLVKYCANKDNNLKPSKKIKKLIKEGN